MSNPRQKGKLGEAKVKEALEKATGLEFDYTPGSGNGVLKGDLHIPKGSNTFCIEVKNYAESHLNDKVLTNKTNEFVGWWTKLVQQAGTKEPLLIYRYNRSKLFVAVRNKPVHVKKYIELSWLSCYIMLLDEWLEKEEIRWLHSSRKITP